MGKRRKKIKNRAGRLKLRLSRSATTDSACEDRDPKETRWVTHPVEPVSRWGSAKVEHLASQKWQRSRTKLRHPCKSQLNSCCERPKKGNWKLFQRPQSRRSKMQQSWLTIRCESEKSSRTTLEKTELSWLTGLNMQPGKSSKKKSTDHALFTSEPLT